MGVDGVDVTVVPPSPSPHVEMVSVVVRTCIESLRTLLIDRLHGMDFTGVCKSVVTLVLVLGINYPYSISPDFVTC